MDYFVSCRSSRMLVQLPSPQSRHRRRADIFLRRRRRVARCRESTGDDRPIDGRQSTTTQKQQAFCPNLDINRAAKTDGLGIEPGRSLNPAGLLLLLLWWGTLVRLIRLNQRRTINRFRTDAHACGCISETARGHRRKYGLLRPRRTGAIGAPTRLRRLSEDHDGQRC